MELHFTGGHISCKGAEEEKSCENLHFALRCVLMTLQLGETNAPYILSRAYYVISLFSKRRAKLVKCWDNFAYLIFGEIKCKVECKRKRCSTQFTQMSRNNDLWINLFKNFKQLRSCLKIVNDSHCCGNSKVASCVRTCTIGSEHFQEYLCEGNCLCL